MKASCCVPLALLCLLDCSSSGQTSLDGLSDIEQIQALTFQKLSERAGHDGTLGIGGRPRCLAAEWRPGVDARIVTVDPSPAVIDYLGGERPRLWPASVCGIDRNGNSFWFPSRPGRTAILLTIDSLEIAPKGSALSVGSYIIAPLNGEIITCDFSLHDDAWDLEHCEQTGWY
jgi:hypothetical protein